MPNSFRYKSESTCRRLLPLSILMLSAALSSTAKSDPRVGLHSSLLALSLSREHTAAPTTGRRTNDIRHIEDFTYNLLEDGTKISESSADKQSPVTAENQVEESTDIATLPSYWQRFRRK